MRLTFTDTERLLLSNQYEILAGQHPDLADDYRRLAKQLRDGHEWLYRQSFQQMSPVLPDDDAKFVHLILGLYGCLKQGYEELSDKSGLNATDVEFPGFDANDSYEINLLGFTEALANAGLYVDTLNAERGANSHYQAVPGYQRMIDTWRAVGQPRDLTREQIEKILAAKRYA